MIDHVSRRQKPGGFTIVELLIVIVVIGILAAITIVSFNGVQARASDSNIRTMAGQLEKAIILWSTDTGLAPRSGYSSTAAFNGTECTDGIGGWVASGAYACTLEDLLVSKNLVPVGFARKAPVNKEYGQQSVNTFMFYQCGTSKTWVLYYYLQNPSAQDTDSITRAESLGCTSGPRTGYKMKAAKVMVLDY